MKMSEISLNLHVSKHTDNNAPQLTNKDFDRPTVRTLWDINPEANKD